MQISGKNILKLPQVKNFSFSIENISVFDLQKKSFNLVDINSFVFPFVFESGLIKTDKIVYGYNNREFVNIKGYVKDGNLSYKINEVYGKITGLFSNLDKLIILNSGEPLDCDVFFNSEPINYSFSFEPSYSVGGELTGNFYSDILFNINDFKLKSLNSNNNLLEKNNYSDLFLDKTVYPGDNYFILNDVDLSKFEYNNSFINYVDTVFDNLILKTSSFRGDFYSKKILDIKSPSGNIFSSSSLFYGAWDNNKFTYSGRKTIYDLFFNFENIDFLGNEIPVSGLIFLSINPQNYYKKYVTGFNLINGGLYSGKEPSLSFTKYYYVDGISQNFQNLLFSSGCQDQIQINYSGQSTGIASGYLEARDVYISGIYGDGINKFKAVFDYYSYSTGNGYTESPIIIWGTGGNCFSLPDVSGEFGQFKKIHGTKSKIKSHADYLYGYALSTGITGENEEITGYIVTGIKITNIGSGYSSLFPAKLSFIRSEEDILTNNASGAFNHINYYSNNPTIEDLIDVSYNFSDTGEYSLIYNSTLNFFSGFFKKPEEVKKISIRIDHNSDYTDPLKINLSFNLKHKDFSKTLTKKITLEKRYDTDTGALNIF